MGERNLLIAPILYLGNREWGHQQRLRIGKEMIIGKEDVLEILEI